MCGSIFLQKKKKPCCECGVLVHLKHHIDPPGKDRMEWWECPKCNAHTEPEPFVLKFR